MAHSLTRSTLSLITVSALLLLAVPSFAEARSLSETPATGSVLEWTATDEFKALAGDPSLVSDRIVTDAKTRARDIALLPDWIRDNRILDAAEVARARARLRPTLDYLKAGALELFIYRNDVPFLALGEKSLLVVSTAMLKEFTDAELRASAAHEIAHLYFFDSYLAAFLKNDGEAIKRIELKCDALGARWSAASGNPADALLRAVKRQYALEAKLGGQDPARAAMYPTLCERVIVICAQISRRDARNYQTSLT